MKTQAGSIQKLEVAIYIKYQQQQQQGVHVNGTSPKSIFCLYSLGTPFAKCHQTCDVCLYICMLVFS